MRTVLLLKNSNLKASVTEVQCITSEIYSWEKNIKDKKHDNIKFTTVPKNINIYIHPNSGLYK